MIPGFAKVADLASFSNVLGIVRAFAFEVVENVSAATDISEIVFRIFKSVCIFLAKTALRNSCA